MADDPFAALLGTSSKKTTSRPKGRGSSAASANKAAAKAAAEQRLDLLYARARANTEFKAARAASSSSAHPTHATKTTTKTTTKKRAKSTSAGASSTSSSSGSSGTSGSKTSKKRKATTDKESRKKSAKSDSGDSSSRSRGRSKGGDAPSTPRGRKKGSSDSSSSGASSSGSSATAGGGESEPTKSKPKATKKKAKRPLSITATDFIKPDAEVVNAEDNAIAYPFVYVQPLARCHNESHTLILTASPPRLFVVFALSLLPLHCSFGTISWWLGRKADESSSHRWLVYVRGIDGEDLSHFVSHVVFKLHESFAASAGGVSRLITKHPFEVEEGGWGEFTIGISVHFVDQDEPPVHLLHDLKLDQSLEEGSKKPVVSEHYDEFVFNRPSEKLRAALLGGPVKTAPPHPLRHLFTEFDETDDILRIQDAQNFVKEELTELQMQIAALLEQNSARPKEYPLALTVGKDEIQTIVPYAPVAARKDSTASSSAPTGTSSASTSSSVAAKTTKSKSASANEAKKDTASKPAPHVGGKKSNSKASSKTSKHAGGKGVGGKTAGKGRGRKH